MSKAAARLRTILPAFLTTLFLLLIFLHLPIEAAERISLYESTIRVRTNGTLEVQEDITVNILHQKIRHGIYRDFPTLYRSGPGETCRAGFDVCEVLLDGNPVPYRSHRKDEDVRVVIGDPDRMAPMGKHTYSIRYRTTGQIGFFDDHDELYWNVTGTGWIFPIDRAVAKVILPEKADAVDLAWYTGPRGSRATNARGGSNGNRIAVGTTRPLGPAEGLTIAVAFDKGHVFPSPEQVAWKKRARMLGLIGNWGPLIGLLLILAYFLLTWFRFGRDGQGRVIPLFSPPKKLIPADGQYLLDQGFLDRGMTATVLDLAIRGYLTIEEISGHTFLGLGSVTGKPAGFRLIRIEGTNPGGRREKDFLNELFSLGNEVDLKKPSPTTRRALEEARDCLEFTVTAACGELLATNYRRSILGMVLTLLLLGGPGLILAGSQRQLPTFLFSSLWLIAWTVGICTILRNVFTTLREGFRQGQGKKILKGSLLSLVSLVFLAGELIGMAMISVGTTVLFPLYMTLALVMNVVFFRIMKSYTPEGRTIMDHIRGFRMFMETAEKERIRALASTSMPEDTPERFERLLPWALALGVEKQWASRFEEVLHTTGYNPGWYSGTTPWHLAGTTVVTGELSSGLGQAISSAATPSGFGGNGFSGGGGGGGGGGGW